MENKGEKINLVLVGIVLILMVMLWGMGNGQSESNLENASLKKELSQTKADLETSRLMFEDLRMRKIKPGKLMASDYDLCDDWEKVKNVIK